MPWTTCVLAMSAAPSATAAADDGWKIILSADDMSGWKTVGPGEFKVDDGAVLTGDGEGMLWYTKEKFGDAEIRVIFKTEKPGDNSGVFIRVDREPKDPWIAVHRGYEVQIDDNRDPWHSTGVLYSLTKAQNKVDLKPGQWITMLIRLDGDRTIVHLNGTLVTDYKEGQKVPERKEWYEPKRGPRANSGYIALQNHDPKSHVWFKQVAVRPIRKR